jgi:hypothetical protein
MAGYARSVHAEDPGRHDAAFFSSLPEISSFADVVAPRSYHDVPVTWLVVVTDVRGSTRAIEAGRYKDVNALGVASIVALRNALADVDVPYVFGGDGATLLVPGAGLPRAETALRGLQGLARDAFALELRVGVVPVAELAAAGHAVRVARYRASPTVCLAMFAGTGLLMAERWIKDPDREAQFGLAQGDGAVDLEGFECRWQPVPSRRGAIVSLLVMARAADDARRAATYRRVLDQLESLCDHETARPVSAGGLKLSGLRADLSVEARVRSGASAGARYDAAAQRVRRQTLIGRVLLAVGARAGSFDGGSYREELVSNTDFRKFDETLRMVLDLSDAECDAYRTFLGSERRAGELVYGMHRASAALVTCFVRSYAGDHLHFVDGADGGYALAAKEMKAQLSGAA